MIWYNIKHMRGSTIISNSDIKVIRALKVVPPTSYTSVSNRSIDFISRLCVDYNKYIQYVLLDPRVDGRLTCGYSSKLDGSAGSNAMFTYFNKAPGGFDLDTAQVGDKYVLSNGSYMLVTRIVGEPTYTVAYLDYCVENGQIAYSNIIVSAEKVTEYQTNISMVPWFCGNESTMKLYNGQLIANASADPPVLSYSLSPVAYSPTTVELGRAFFEGIAEIDPDDPYPGDDSGGGKDPDPDGIPEPDDIPIPTIPDVDITDTGFITLFTPSLAQVKNLANYMWSDLFSLDSFKKLFADPMDCILGFNVLPVVVPAGSVSEIIVGNLATRVYMTKCTSQWVEFDCGTVNVGTPYDTYLDYSPYTKYSIYLPYIGLQSLSADDVVGKTIHLVYHIDALSCSCVAYLLCGSSVLYQFAGSCGYSIPLTGDSFRNVVSSMISIATTVAGAVATGGISAPLAISAGASIAQNVINAKPEVKRSGSIGSAAGIMGVQTPYLILEIPRICKPKDQHKYLGYPSFITDSVGNVPGYSEWESVILSGVPCTDEERASIEEILKGGVYNV